MVRFQFPHAIDVDLSAPVLPRPAAVSRFATRKLSARVILGQARSGQYDCFDPTTPRFAYFSRFGLSMAEANYIEMVSQISEQPPFALGMPVLPYAGLPATLRMHFAAGGALFWSRCPAFSLWRQWQRLHCEPNLRPGGAVRRSVVQREGVPLGTAEIARRITTWERLRDGVGTDGPWRAGPLLDLEELGQDLQATLAAACVNAGRDPGADSPGVALMPQRDCRFERSFAAPEGTAMAVDESYNQMREILEFHEIWFLSATPFDLSRDLGSGAIFALPVPLSPGIDDADLIINDMSVFAVRHVAHA